MWEALQRRLLKKKCMCWANAAMLYGARIIIEDILVVIQNPEAGNVAKRSTGPAFIVAVMLYKDVKKYHLNLLYSRESAETLSKNYISFAVVVSGISPCLTVFYFIQDPIQALEWVKGNPHQLLIFVPFVLMVALVTSRKVLFELFREEASRKSETTG